MSALTRWLRGPWGTPIVSGLLIVVAAIFSLTAGVNPLGAGHQHGIGFSLEGPTALVVSDLFMIAAALVAGIPIILKAVRALMVKVIDRKSTRLNSSHVAISYAVFCLKKKKRVNPSQNPNHTTRISV